MGVFSSELGVSLSLGDKNSIVMDWPEFLW